MDLDSGLDVLGINVIFEPVTSPEYGAAREEYRQGLRLLNNGSGNTINLGKASFTRCLIGLRDLYSKGEVESIDALPLPHEICWFDMKQLKDLSRKLSQFYFSNRR